MIGYRDRYVQANGLWFHYLEWGAADAPVVVLLHGTTQNAHAWDEISEFLAPRFRVIALDCRNHGESDGSPDPVNPLVLADDVHIITQELGIERMGVIGLSMGGRQAMTFAGFHPERVDWLVIEDMAPSINPAGSASVAERLANIPESWPNLEEFKAWLREMDRYASDAWMDWKALTHRVPLRGGRVALKYFPVRGQPTPATLPPGWDLWEHIRKIEAPTLLIWGLQSEVMTQELADRMVETIPNCRAVAIDQAGHPVHEDNPAGYKAALTEFLGGLGFEI